MPNTLTPHTVCDLVRDAVSRLNAAQVSFGHGTDNAFDEACVLLRHVLHLPFDLDLTDLYWTAALRVEECKTFEALLVKRIESRTPAPYLTGEAFVQGVRLLTAPDVIIPRSLIGELLESGGLDPWLNAPVETILDLCTGSAAIAIQSALFFPGSSIDAVDISDAAINLANRNIALHDLQQSVRLLKGDLYEAVPAHTYDLIVSNPPYVNSQSMAQLPAEYLTEPHLALAGGIDGMDIVRKIINNAAQHLNEDGLLLIEIGNEAMYFEQAFPKLPFVYLPVTQSEQGLVLIQKQDLVAI